MTARQAELLLGCLVLSRSTAFVFSKLLLEDFSSFNIIGVRSLLAFVLLAIVFYKRLKGTQLAEVGSAALISLFYAGTMSCEMFAMPYISIGEIAFITNSCMLQVPFWNYLLYREPISRHVLLCALIAFSGIGVMSLSMESKGSLLGIFFALCASISYAFMLIMTKRFADKADPMRIGVLQIGFLGLVTLLMAGLTGSIGLPTTSEQWGYYAVLILLCTCFGFTYQPLAQKYVSAQRAGLMCALGPLGATLFSYLTLGEALSGNKIVGCILILCGVLWMQVKRE